MKHWSAIGRPGIVAALVAAALFGSGTPLAKVLLGDVNPWMLAALFYLGSGVGLWLYRLVRRTHPVVMPRDEWPWLAGAIVSGGVVGPVLLMLGLTNMPASGAALLLNAESVFTALIAWIAFRENVDRRVALGMLSIVVGALILSWPTSLEFSDALPALSILAACLAWGIDNNLTRRVSLTDATWIASTKGWVAGSVNLALALALGAAVPAWPYVLGAALVGFAAYGISLALFVFALRSLGTARTGAYYSVAPFFGATLAVPLLSEPVTASLLLAGLMMALGIWLHLTERHDHLHVHEPLVHDHLHVHDAHHQHAHAKDMPVGQPHRHVHQHEPLAHQHEHFPDAHHRHRHDAQPIIRPMIESNDRSLKLAGSVLVTLQFGLIAWQFALAAPAIMQGRFPLASWLLAGAAVALAVWTLAHNRIGNFNIHPEPKSSGELITTGPYRWIRHPMYTTVLIGAAALAWMPGTALAWLAWAALVVVLFIKLTMEERWLRKHYASYEAYERVSKRLLPWIF